MEQAEEIGSVYQTLAEILTTAETSFFWHGCGKERRIDKSTDALNKN